MMRTRGELEQQIATVYKQHLATFMGHGPATVAVTIRHKAVAIACTGCLSRWDRAIFMLGNTCPLSRGYVLQRYIQGTFCLWPVLKVEISKLVGVDLEEFSYDFELERDASQMTVMMAAVPTTVLLPPGI